MLRFFRRKLPGTKLSLVQVLQQRPVARAWLEQRVTYYRRRSHEALLKHDHALAGHFNRQAWLATGQLTKLDSLNEYEFVEWWLRKASITSSGSNHTLVRKSQ